MFESLKLTAGSFIGVAWAEVAKALAVDLLAQSIRGAALTRGHWNLSRGVFAGWAAATPSHRLPHQCGEAFRGECIDCA